ncbi:MAG: RNA-binding domain-containing protein [Candidatus Binatia bacterium]
MGSKYQLERDHIFPYSKLKEVGYGEANRVKYALAQELTNRAILAQVANRTKSNTNAADYLASVKARFPKALELQCIPEDPELWKIENYERFLEERRGLLAKHLSTFLEKITATEKTVVPVSVEDLIAEGESDELEFKATLRWDLKEAVVNKKLEEVVIKAIAAFANSQGGTLLIGVADDGDVIGLEPDYQSLGDVDRDKFELHLRNLLNQQFGTGFVTTKVVINFHEVGEKEVCQVETSTAREPVIVTVKDKNGQSVEKFYARSGNSSQEIPLSEMNAYIKERFHS